MSEQQRYTEDIKIEAIKQVTERQHPDAEHTLTQSPPNLPRLAAP
ncbi:hypothetical protein [Sulfuriferula plumbiphila]|nr:hypothetical protein [Sulfuriferula plumbiphila]